MDQVSSTIISRSINYAYMQVNFFFFFIQAVIAEAVVNKKYSRVCR